jgi:hypothetical protein
MFKLQLQKNTEIVIIKNCKIFYVFYVFTFSRENIKNIKSKQKVHKRIYMIHAIGSIFI